MSKWRVTYANCQCWMQQNKIKESLLHNVCTPILKQLSNESFPKIYKKKTQNETTSFTKIFDSCEMEYNWMEKKQIKIQWKSKRKMEIDIQGEIEKERKVEKSNNWYSQINKAVTTKRIREKWFRMMCDRWI